jgi:hypothetical protein
MYKTSSPCGAYIIHFWRHPTKLTGNTKRASKLYKKGKIRTFNRSSHDSSLAQTTSHIAAPHNNAQSPVQVKEHKSNADEHACAHKQARHQTAQVRSREPRYARRQRQEFEQLPKANRERRRAHVRKQDLQRDVQFSVACRGACTHISTAWECTPSAYLSFRNQCNHCSTSQSDIRRPQCHTPPIRADDKHETDRRHSSQRPLNRVERFEQ